jgi:protein-disulfide isomerase
VAIGIIAGAAVVASREGGTSASSAPGAAKIDPSAPLPKGVFGPDDQFAFGVPVGTPNSENVRSLQVWEDFQCPACKIMEDLNGQGIKALGQSGRVKLVYRPTTFLDVNLGNDASVRATAAWGCAIDQDKTTEYHQTLFANQPEREGQGWTQEELIGFGSQIGLADDALATFTKCVQDGTYRQWAVNSTAVFYDKQITGTPTGIIDDSITVTNTVLGDPVELEKALFGPR